MTRRLWLLNLALAGLIIGTGWRLRVVGEQAAARESSLRAGQTVRIAAPPEPPLPKPAPLVAADYAEIAQKMLFAPDRNPAVIVEAAPAKVMPPLPVAHGTLELGGLTMALLSEKPAAPHRAYMPGDKVGAFVLAAVSRDELTFEWEGQKITRRLAELMEARARPGSPAAATPAEPAAPPAAATTIQTGSAQGQPGIQLDTDIRACVPGDNSPAGTVSDGYRKVVQRTPFGNMCRWEAVK